ncbi:MAG: helix-turn-helix transcriptional regulator [Acidobacteriota bacterium]
MDVDVNKLRAELGISMEALARKLGVSYISVFNWSHGTRKPSGLANDQLVRLARQVARQKEREAAAKRIAEANGEMLHVT